MTPRHDPRTGVARYRNSGSLSAGFPFPPGADLVVLTDLPSALSGCDQAFSDIGDDPLWTEIVDHALSILPRHHTKGFVPPWKRRGELCIERNAG